MKCLSIGFLIYYMSHKNDFWIELACLIVMTESMTVITFVKITFLAVKLPHF